jgi:uncharacterized membrane protein YbhN (UPF0104 family)
MSAHPHSSLSLLALASALSLGAGLILPGAQARGVGEIVMAVCLNAFENEMAQVGKRPPAGMANYACACVVDQISNGNSLDVARTSCRTATARRYPI